MKLLDRFSKAKKVVVIRKKRANGNADKEDDEGNVEDVRREPKFIEKELKLDQIEAVNLF